MEYLTSHNTIRERDLNLLYKRFGQYTYRCLASEIEGTVDGIHQLTRWEASIDYNSTPHTVRIEIHDGKHIKSTIWREYRF